MKLKADTFLNGIGGSRMFFLAGILITWVFYSDSYSSFKHTILGI
jgi:hypothetical protein